MREFPQVFLRVNLLSTNNPEKFNLDLFNQERIHRIAESVKVSKQVFETLDEKGLNVLENWIASLVDSTHLWPDQYGYGKG